MTKALFFDVDSTVRVSRSGTIVPNTPDDVEAIPKAAERLAQFRDGDFLLIAVSNQGGIEAGYSTVEDTEAAFAETWKQLLIYPDAVYYSPSIDRDDPMRKPNPGAALKAAEEHEVDLARSWMVGDMTSDEEFSENAGIGTFIWTEDWLQGKFDLQSTQDS